MEESTVSVKKFCECGCGSVVKNRFKLGHVGRLRTGSKHQNWKGGRLTNYHGYIMVLKPEHPHSDKDGYVPEHRLVMEEYLGRYLSPNEIVHHKDENRQNNNISNLQIMTRAEHKKHHNPDVTYHIKDMSNISCSVCNSKTTYLRKRKCGLRPEWVIGSISKKLVCSKCYNKEYKLSH